METLESFVFDAAALAVAFVCGMAVGKDRFLAAVSWAADKIRGARQ